MVDDAKKIRHTFVVCAFFLHLKTFIDNLKLNDMEKIQVFSNHESYERLQQLLKLPEEVKRFKFYQKTIFQERFGTKKETDTHIYWSVCSYVPRFENNTLFYTMKDKEGFTYDKQKKTLKAWWNRPLARTDMVMVRDILVHFESEWFFGMHEGLRTMLTIPLLKRIIKKKITNPNDFVKSYLKSSPYRKLDISPNLLINHFKKGLTGWNSNFYTNIKAIRLFLEYSTNANHAFEMINRITKDNDFYVLMTDMYNQAAMLNLRINPMWSDSRMKEEHTEMTRKIMELELKSLDKIDYNYPDTFDSIKLDSLYLVKDNYELFEEGTKMKHCVYTNYKNDVQNKRYFVLQYKQDNVRATVGLSVIDLGIDKREIRLQQMYGIGNTSIDYTHKEKVENWLTKPEIQDYFLKIYNNSKVALQYNQEQNLVFEEVNNVGIY